MGLGTRFFSWIFISYTITGKINITTSDTLLVVANHKSYWDPFIIGSLMPFFSHRHTHVGFMVSDRFFKNKLLALCFFLIGAKPSYKGEGLDISLLYPRTVLKVGGIFLIFPFGKILSKQTEDGSLPFPGRGAATLRKFETIVICLTHFLKEKNYILSLGIRFG